MLSWPRFILHGTKPPGSGSRPEVMPTTPLGPWVSLLVMATATGAGLQVQTLPAPPLRSRGDGLVSALPASGLIHTVCCSVNGEGPGESVTHSKNHAEPKQGVEACALLWHTFLLMEVKAPSSLRPAVSVLMETLCSTFRYLAVLPPHILRNDHVKKFFSTSPPTQQLQSPSEFVRHD